MWSNFISLGEAMRDIVLGIAGLLVQEYTPGLVAAVLIFGLGIASLLYWRQVNKQITTLKWLRSIINGHETPQSFTSAITEIDIAIKEKRRDKSYASVVAAWTEYRETLVLHGEGEARHLRNSVRPSRECPVFCVWLIGSMLPERSKDDADFERTAGRAAEGLQAA